MPHTKQWNSNQNKQLAKQTHHGGAASVGALWSFPPVTTRLVAAQGGGSASFKVDTRGELRPGLAESGAEMTAASVPAGARIEVGAETASVGASSRRDLPTPASQMA
jgi:hypothetical protein